MIPPPAFDPLVAYGNFPEPPDRLIERDNVLDTLERTFEAGSQLVTVEGPEGIGKSTLLADN
jgi:ATP/maltotriose-dependent transcriptional regulator MalT